MKNWIFEIQLVFEIELGQPTKEWACTYVIGDPREPMYKLFKYQPNILCIKEKMKQRVAESDKIGIYQNCHLAKSK